MSAVPAALLARWSEAFQRNRATGPPQDGPFGQRLALSSRERSMEYPGLY